VTNKQLFFGNTERIMDGDSPMKKIKLLAAVCLAMSATAIANAAETDVIPTQKLVPALHDQLPADIIAKGSMISVNNGSFPPYEIVVGNQQLKGAAADFDKALGELLGITIEHKTVNGLSSLLMGIQSGRYQYASGPIGDFKDREQAVDFVDYVQEFVVFAVHKGNPQQINSLADTCGKRIAVMSGGSAERVLKAQVQQCQKDGKPALQVQSYGDQPTSILAVKANRADAFFSSQAPLAYFVQMSNGQLELSGTGQKNGFGDLYQGAVVPKNSRLGQALLASYTELHKNGTYAAIMKKWNLDGNTLATPAINLAGKQ
jgi:polar amino acid transport system substrate-binding protein